MDLSTYSRRSKIRNKESYFVKNDTKKETAGTVITQSIQILRD